MSDKPNTQAEAQVSAALDDVLAYCQRKYPHYEVVITMRDAAHDLQEVKHNCGDPKDFQAVMLMRAASEYLTEKSEGPTHE